MVGLTGIAGRRAGKFSLGMAQRLGLSAALLGDPPARRGHGVVGRPAAVLRDRPGWRAAAYLLVKLPVTVAEIYAVALAALGLTELSYPFWWALFRNHPSGVVLQPVPVFTALGTFDIRALGGTFAAFAAGAAMILAAPWVAGGAAAADCWLMRGMLGPGRLAQGPASVPRRTTAASSRCCATWRPEPPG